jgi:anti-anti-sigma factor
MFISSQDHRNNLKHKKDIAIAIEHSHTISNLKIVTLKGYFDIGTSRYVDEQVLPLMETGESDFILDVSDLDYLSSIGMMSLTKYQLLLTKKKRFLKLIKPPKPICDVMAVFGFTKRFEMYDSVVEAVSSLR